MKNAKEITRKVSKLELCDLCAECLIIWIYIPIKVHPNTLNSFWSFRIYTEICEKINIKKYLSPKKCIFHQKLEPTEKNMASHERRDPEKPCVKFEESRLNTLRENRICQKVNQSAN